MGIRHQDPFVQMCNLLSTHCSRAHESQHKIKSTLFQEIIIIKLFTGQEREKRPHIDYRSMRGAVFHPYKYNNNKH